MCLLLMVIKDGSSHLGTGPGPDASHILQFGLVEHPAVAKFLQTDIFCWSSLTALTLLKQQLELLLTPDHSGPQILHQDTVEGFEYSGLVEKVPAVCSFVFCSNNKR